ncbi:exodeoxyribonuclease V subunit alpha [Acinetobacter sp. 194]|nr:exodeoxyribonuclease V subunit alpha [Acinetobacter shaoyimingii]
MDNNVENWVDNFEDNCVENVQDLESEIPQWISTWAKYLLKSAFLDINLNEESIKLVEQIVLANAQGDSCLSRPEQFDVIFEKLAIDEKLATQQVSPFVYDDEYVYLYRYWQLEYRLAQQIRRLTQQKIQSVDVQTFEHLLTDTHQKAALTMVADHAFNIITGGPGTGKTYTLARIIAVLSQAIPDIRIAMAAPTGKAAQRMKEALQGSLNDEKLNELGLVSDALKNQETLTIHRLLGLGTQYQPRFHLKQPLPYDVIVIDEASMLDLNLATLLFEAVPDQSRLILLGDANQLASVDVGAVLADLQQVPQLQENHVNLITSRRFRDGAKIGEMAQFIQSQNDAEQLVSNVLNRFEQQIVQASELQAVDLFEDMEDVVQLEYLKEQFSSIDLDQYYQKLSWGYQGYFEALKQYVESDYAENLIEKVVQSFDEYRILTAIRHGEFGLDALNEQMKKALLSTLKNIIPQGDWFVGRPVMMSYNDYQLGLSNGDIGLCFKHRCQLGQFEVYFPSLNKWIPATRLPKSIQTAFALTVHKSQGSEFKHTAVVLDDSASKLLSQELIYTAITRAKSVVSLLVAPNALRQAFCVKSARCSGVVKKLIQ